MSGIKFNTGTCLLFVDDTEDDRPTEGGGGGGGTEERPGTAAVSEADRLIKIDRVVNIGFQQQKLHARAG